MEVVQLLDKLQPDMITQDAASVGQVHAFRAASRVPAELGLGLTGQFLRSAWGFDRMHLYLHFTLHLEVLWRRVVLHK